MPSISKIRFTNVIYENGLKRYNDDIFEFDGYNGSILLENGGGKTVFIQTAIQAVLPHSDMGDRKIRETLSLEGSPCHIAIEWILNDRPRRYALTAVTLFLNNNKLDSYKYAYEYMYNDEHRIENLPFVKVGADGRKRPTGKGEISEYYQYMKQQYMMAETFKTITDFHKYIEENFKIIPSEWRNIASINANEGGVEGFFEGCSTTRQLVDKLLIPVVEEAISEKGTQDFVNTFEKHREHFKKHKQLQERIDESKQIEVQINRYVGKYYKYHSAKEELINKKSYTKGLYLLAKDEDKVILDKINENKVEREEIVDGFNELEKKKDSYDLAVLKNDLDESEKIFIKTKEEYDSFQYQYEDRKKKLANLNIAKVKSEINEVKGNIEINEKQIERLVEELNLEEINEELQENSSKIKGYFLNEERGLTKEKDLLESQKESYDKQLEDQKTVEKELVKSKEKIKADMDNNNGKILILEKELKSIESKLPHNGEKENIRESKIKWSGRIGQLEKNIVDFNNEINLLENERVSINYSMKSNRIELDELKNQQVLASERLAAIDDKQSNLLLKIKTINDSWDYINSLYLKQDSIINYIESTIERLVSEKETILLNERISRRFADDYYENKYFTVEPLLEKWIYEWKNDFSFIEAGTRYIQRAAEVLGTSEEDYYRDYPYWPISLVVSDYEIEKVKKNIDKVIDKVTYPIIVLSDSEARNILDNGKVIEEHMVFPMYWQDNLNEISFVKWKEELKAKSEEITKLRKSKEWEIGNFSTILSEIRDFFIQYNYEYYQQLKSDNKNLEEKIYSKTMLINNMEMRLNEIYSSISQLNKKRDEAKDESNTLNNWVQLAQDYLSREKDKESLEIVKYNLKEQLNNKNIEIESLNKEISRNKSICQDLHDDINKFNDRINSLKAEELYIEILKSEPIFSHESRNTLETERKRLKELLNSQQGDIKNLRDAIDRDNVSLIKLKNDLERKRKQSDYIIDEEMVFPSYGEEEIEKLIEEINYLKPDKKNLEKSLKEAEKKYNGLSEVHNIRRGDYFRKHIELLEFSKSLYEVKISLECENEELTKRQDKNKKIEILLSKEKESIDEALQILNTKHERFRYLAEDIKACELNEDTKREFPYNRKNLVLKAIDTLEDLENKLSETTQDLDKEKNNFERFCSDNIKDIRLKQRTVEGMRYKDNYDDVLEWQNKMQDNLARIIKVAEDDMREHDKQLEHFIEHLNKYLATLTEELKVIPKNTRIKVEDKWKEIFKFDVPDWNEQEGKQELRKHVDWMIKQLENPDFKNDDGTDNDTEIRKEIEKWLDSKQLLGIVMKNKDIKVSCRKVTNDGKISSTPTTWESSNKWSGGEKWSKNMTLFLGILRYLAEKRQSIITNHGTNRTVIVDNPFGKASSDHVLDPVFFIADKLGFQIIALTAHVEGKFIRNYFPVVYSCKLRDTVNSNSQIIDKEKEINHAFFKDNDPRALLRLGEEKQLDLFS